MSLSPADSGATLGAATGGGAEEVCDSRYVEMKETRESQMIGTFYNISLGFHDDT